MAHMNSPTDPKQFWEHKILSWEKDRYGDNGTEGSLLERIASRSGRSLRFRQTAAYELLRPFVTAKRVVEIGCGSGMLAVGIVAMGAESYRGYDIAESAVEQARQRADAGGITGQATFETASVGDLQSLDADIVISLGLLDWLEDGELDALFRAGGEADYLHAIAEKRLSASQMLHRLYVHLAYGHKTGGYVPRYYAPEEIAAIAGRYIAKPLCVWRDPRLSFGAFVSSMPIDSR